jgi:hypothetical protein
LAVAVSLVGVGDKYREMVEDGGGGYEWLYFSLSVAAAVVAIVGFDVVAS